MVIYGMRIARTSAALLATGALWLGTPVPAGAGVAVIGAGARPVPAHFEPEAVNLLSPSRVFVLGSSPCGKSRCTTMLGTTDGGKTWQELAAPGAPLGTPGFEVTGGVSQVAFANPTDGWAYGPALWATSDGARSWHREGLGGPVLTLTASGSFAFAVVGSCSLSSATCTKPKVRLERSPVTTTGWANVPGLTGSDNGEGAFFATHGRHIWLALWPKSPGRATSLAERGRHQMAELTGRLLRAQRGHRSRRLGDSEPARVVRAVRRQPGGGPGAKGPSPSANGGATTHETGTLPLGGLSSGVAAANDQDVAVTSRIGGEFHLLFPRDGGRPGPDARSMTVGRASPVSSSQACPEQ